MLHVVLYQPDIPHNLGAILRLCACFEVRCHIVEPCGFPLSDKNIKRVALDYGAHVEVRRYPSWGIFEREHLEPNNIHAHRERIQRLILLSKNGQSSLYRFDFREGDALLFGRESSGVPVQIHEQVVARVFIPQKKGRSLNVAAAAAVTLGEATRQLESLSSL